MDRETSRTIRRAATEVRAVKDSDSREDSDRFGRALHSMFSSPVHVNSRLSRLNKIGAVYIYKCMGIAFNLETIWTFNTAGGDGGKGYAELNR